jgi:glycosyltransferase involved in cell wall biosynthesis
VNMQLIVVTPNFWIEAGIGNAVRELTQELMKLSVELIAVVHGDSSAHLGNTHETIPNISIGLRKISVLKPFSRYILSMRAAEALKLLSNKIGDDCIIHSHSLFPTAFLGNGYKSKNVSFITTIHGINEGEIKRFKKDMFVSPQELRYRFAGYVENYVWGTLFNSLPRPSRSHIIALSPENFSIFKAKGLSQSKLHFLPNGVNINFYRPYNQDEARRKLNLPAKKLIILTISNIEPRKGIHLLIKAAPGVINEEPNAYFVIVGRVKKANMWYFLYLKKLINKFGLNKFFKFVGFVPTEELPLYLNSADMFVIASYAEGAPLVIPQAMACKRVIIATQGAAAGYLPPNLVVQNGNYEALSQKISFYLSSTKERRIISKELYQKAINEFSWTNIAKRTMDLYQKIICNET